MLKKLVASIAIVMLALTLTPSPAAADPWPHTRYGWCLPFTLNVAPGPDQPSDWKVSATYCQPWEWAPGRHRVDVLTHGATYTHMYWDWPQADGVYHKHSYVNRALANGRATLNYDRIGNGNSTRPASSTDITMATDAHVLHQLVTLLRLFGFRHIASVSHSYGSGVALQEAATYQDVTSVVVSGYLHRPSNPAVTAGNYPANQDPKFAHLGLDNGWLTSRPGVRGTSFHSPSSEALVVEQDELHKDLVSLTGLLSFLSARGVPAGDNISNQVTVPVLVITGDQDAIFCYQPAVFNCSDLATVRSNEEPFYMGSPKLEVAVVPTAGHSLALHPTSSPSYWIIDRFVSKA